MPISCLPLPLESLPADVDEVSPQRALTAVRAALGDAAAQPADAADFALWKSKLETLVSRLMSTSAGFVETLHARYAWNKDVTTRYQETIARLAPEDVRAFLAALASGGRVEYLVP